MCEPELMNQLQRLTGGCSCPSDGMPAVLKDVVVN
jgi:hypothetical protein